VFQAYGSPTGAIRLAAKICFALFPFVRGRLAAR
jgi:hypothetical protein